MQRLEAVGAVHTGYIIKISKVELRKNMRLFSNVFLFAYAKSMQIEHIVK